MFCRRFVGDWKHAIEQVEKLMGERFEYTDQGRLEYHLLVFRSQDLESGALEHTLT